MPINYLEVKDRKEAEKIAKELEATEWKFTKRNDKMYVILRTEIGKVCSLKT